MKKRIFSSNLTLILFIVEFIQCMNQMLSKDIRHLPLLDDDGKVIGILSVKDLVKVRERKCADFV